MIASVTPIFSDNVEAADESRHRVTVTWINDETLNGFWNIDPIKVQINQKIAMIVYSLSAASTRNARFDLKEPVIWSSPAPDNFVVSLSENADQVFIADLNTTKGPEQSFSFRLQVVYDGLPRISPDPTIINVEPT